MKLKPREIIMSWDFLASLIIAGFSYFLFRPEIKSDFAKDMYGIGISVLAIVFSVYFAALAIIISSGDNEFVEFLETRGYYSIIIGAFQFSLAVLFIALIYSVVAYTITAYNSSNQISSQPIVWFCLFMFLFPYGLFATANSSLDAIKYAEYRVKFLLSRKKGLTKDKESNEPGNKRFKG